MHKKILMQTRQNISNESIRVLQNKRMSFIMGNHGETRKSGLGTVGLVLGIIGICTSFIPIINNLSFVMGVLAVIFGFIALVKQDSKGKQLLLLF